MLWARPGRVVVIEDVTDRMPDAVLGMADRMAHAR